MDQFIPFIAGLLIGVALTVMCMYISKSNDDDDDFDFDNQGFI